MVKLLKKELKKIEYATGVPLSQMDIKDKKEYIKRRKKYLEPKLSQLTNEDLKLQLDKSIEQGNKKRKQSVLREIKRREEKNNIELA